MKKFLICVLSLVLALSMAACGGNAETEGTVTVGTIAHDDSMVRDETAQIPNPWQECASLEEAGELAGFSFTAPETVDGLPERYIAAIENDVAEVIFSNGGEDDSMLYFRKGVGTEDISGDYNSYDTVEEQVIGDRTVTCKGHDGLVYTATWNDGTYSYAVMSNAGMNAETLAAWVQSLA